MTVFSRVCSLLCKSTPKIVNQRAFTTPIRTLFNISTNKSFTNLTGKLYVPQLHLIRTNTTNQMAVPKDGIEIYNSTTAQLFRRLVIIAVTGTSLIVGFSVVYCVFDIFPMKQVIPVSTFMTLFFVAGSVGGYRLCQRVIGKINIHPDNTLALYPVGFPTFSPPIIVPVNDVMPIFADARLSTFGSQLKIIKNRDQFNKLTFDNTYIINVNSNSILGKARDAFDHLCGSNLSFQKK